MGATFLIVRRPTHGVGLDAAPPLERPGRALQRLPVRGMDIGRTVDSGLRSEGLDPVIKHRHPFVPRHLPVRHLANESAAHHEVRTGLLELRQAPGQISRAATGMGEHQGGPRSVPLEDGVAAEEIRLAVRRPVEEADAAVRVSRCVDDVDILDPVVARVEQMIGLPREPRRTALRWRCSRACTRNGP